MVMEYLEGQDLARLLEESGRLPVEDAVAHVLEACDAIAEAHSVGIVHRDLKPANLFLARQPDGSSRIKVLDFGISKAMMTTTGMDPSLTRTSSMMGSPLYMSPEQMKSAKNVDPRTDVWALGVILYELLHGEPPFYAESIPELSAKVLLEEPASIRSKRADVPEGLEAAVKRALAKDTAQRFQTVAELAFALLPFAPARSRVNVERAARVLKTSAPDFAKSAPGTKAEPAPAAYARTAAAWTEPAREPPANKGKGAVLGAAIAAVVVVGGGAFLLSNRGATSDHAGSTAQPISQENRVQPAAEPARAPEPPPAAVPVAPAPSTETPSAPAASAKPAASAVPAAKRPGTAVPSHPAVQKPKAAKPEPAAASKPAADPFSGFGSRK
jgi:serine/threonine-protein kinase